jgi:uncharacterized protein HemY
MSAAMALLIVAGIAGIVLLIVGLAFLSDASPNVAATDPYWKRELAEQAARRETTSGLIVLALGMLVLLAGFYGSASIAVAQADAASTPAAGEAGEASEAPESSP